MTHPHRVHQAFADYTAMHRAGYSQADAVRAAIENALLDLIQDLAGQAEKCAQSAQEWGEVVGGTEGREYQMLAAGAAEVAQIIRRAAAHDD